MVLFTRALPRPREHPLAKLSLSLQRVTVLLEAHDVQLLCTPGGKSHTKPSFQNTAFHFWKTKEAEGKQQKDDEDVQKLHCEALSFGWMAEKKLSAKKHPRMESSETNWTHLVFLGLTFHLFSLLPPAHYSLQTQFRISTTFLELDGWSRQRQSRADNDGVRAATSWWRHSVGSWNDRKNCLRFTEVDHGQ